VQWARSLFRSNSTRVASQRMCGWTFSTLNLQKALVAPLAARSSMCSCWALLAELAEMTEDPTPGGDLCRNSGLWHQPSSHGGRGRASVKAKEFSLRP
jgi:hypothetical protein